MEIKKMYISEDAPGRPGTIITPKALVIHWTANTDPGADAQANRDYFNNSGRAVSAHYVVDDHQVIQCLPENEMAYHVGAQEYTDRALEKLSDYPNDCTLGIEICVNRDGVFRKALQNAIELAIDICKRYGWGRDNLWRHYDVTGKHCPGFFVDQDIAITYGLKSPESGWERFRADVHCGMREQKVLVLINGQHVDAPTKIKDGRSYLLIGGKWIPVLALAEAIGAEWEWYGQAKTVSLIV